MDVHFFATGSPASWSWLFCALEERVACAVLHVYGSIDDLVTGLRHVGWDPPVVVLVGSEDELHQLAGVREQLFDHRLVLIPHNARPETLRKGHLFRPRVLVPQPVDPETVAAIVTRMISRQTSTVWEGAPP